MKEVAKLGEFLNEVSIIRREWEIPSHNELWFRGESKDYGDTKLRPGLYQRPSGEVPKSVDELLEIKHDLFEHFERCSAELVNQDFDSFDTYFLMQHYGCPSRLLDWSDGALLALHFAIRQDIERGSDRYVYVLDPYRLVDHIDLKTRAHKSTKQLWVDYCKKHSTESLSEEDWEDSYAPAEQSYKFRIPEFPLVLEFQHLTRRISAQRSRFMVFGRNPDFFALLLEETDSRIRTIKITKDSVLSMRLELRDAGVTESVIFPDLDGLGREIKQLWQEHRSKEQPVPARNEHPLP